MPKDWVKTRSAGHLTKIYSLMTNCGEGACPRWVAQRP
jgi:phosphoribosyl-AMP cyclohydrolase